MSFYCRSILWQVSNAIISMRFTIMRNIQGDIECTLRLKKHFVQSVYNFTGYLDRNIYT